MKAPASPDRVIQAVQLEDVRLRSGHFSRRVSSPSEAGKVVVEISHSARAESLPGRSAFQVVFDGKAALRPAEGESTEPALEVQVEIELRYAFPKGTEFTPEELAAFAGLNGVFNAWPYFREFLQSATTRMGLPQFVLPVFRVRKAPKAKPAAGMPSARRTRPRP